MDGVFKKVKINLQILRFVILIQSVLFIKNVFADEFQYQYRSARYLGRGDTGIASTSGVDAMFYNPAGIGQGPTQFKEFVLISPQVEASSNSYSAYKQKEEGNTQVLNYIIDNKNTPYYAAGQNASGIAFKKFAIAAMQRGELSAALNEDISTGIPSLKVNSTIWNGGYVTMAHDFWKNHLLIGITGKYVRKTQYNLNLTALQIDSQMQNNTITQSFLNSERKGDALGADVGSMIIFDKETETQIGAVVRNIGMNYNWVLPPTGLAPDRDPQQFDAGATTSFGTKRGRVKLFVDYRDIFNIQNTTYTKHTHIGMEYNLENTFIVMMGSNQGYMTYGAALNIKFMRFEGGSYTEEVGNRPGETPSNRYFGRISIGWLI